MSRDRKIRHRNYETQHLAIERSNRKVHFRGARNAIVASRPGKFVGKDVHLRKCIGAVVVKGEFILLGKRSPDRELCPNVWDVFGGHVEHGESHEQTLVRELAEELGVVPTIWRHLETVNDPNATHEQAVECHFYVVTEWTGNPTNQQPEEHAEVQWFALEDACHLELPHPDYVRIFRAAVAHPGRAIRNPGRSDA